jgi:flagellar biosynthesis protein FlhF
MRIKSYFAASVQEAIERARQELGIEAMLISSKKTGPEASRLGAYEVVFGVTGETTAPRPEPRSTTVRPSESSDPVARELSDLRKQIENVRRSVSRQTYSPASGLPRSPELTELYELLIGAEFSDDTAQELVQAVADRVSGVDLTRPGAGNRRHFAPEMLTGTLREEIEQSFEIAPELAVTGAGQRIIAFVGPSGAGKTTSLAKVAAKFGLGKRIPVEIISIDTLRIGGSEQLGAYARIMGVGFQALSGVAALERALEEVRPTTKLVLIDTPGLGRVDTDEATQIQTFLSRNPHIEVQLVLPATLRNSTMTSLLKRFAEFRPTELLFTHFDEVDAPGAVLDPAIRSRLPISFLGTGQQIPDDLVEPSKALLTDKMFGRVKAASFAA